MVWSDPEIKRLSKQFVTVADEAYYLYPENPQHRQQALSRPDHVFFKRFGESVPPRMWNPGTKQGIYMMGPDAEYLEARFAASDDPNDIRQRMMRALDKWETLKQEKGYANKPIPPKPWAPPQGVSGELILRANIRDLPRGPGDKSGARRHEIAPTGMWMDFVKWAWNENWFGVPRSSALIPKSTNWESVDETLIKSFAQKILVDNVRGQAQEWSATEIKTATVSMRKLDDSNFEYTGSFSMAGGARGYDATLYGKAKWVSNQFESFDWVVMGMRRGASRFNQRENDPGPAPMGVTLSLRKQ